MIQKPLVSIVLFAFVFSLTGCEGEPSLTGEQMRQRYPDQTYMSIDGVSLRYPDNVHKLALMSTPLSSDPLSLNVRLLGIRFVGEALSGDWLLRRILKDGVLQPDAMSDAKVQEYLELYQRDPGARQAVLKFLREFNLNQAIEREILPRLDELTMPILLVWGGQDPYTTMDLARRLDVAIPQADLQVVTNTGHYLLEERPEEVHALLKEFIDT